jgi:putative membrane protein
MKEKNLNGVIWVVSIVIPVLVAFLFYGVQTKVDVGFNTRSLPLLHAVLNGATAVLLLASLYFIKNGAQKAHRNANITAGVLSACFLVSYVIYHATNPSTKFGGEGTIKYIYYFILLTHILLAAVIVPFVLFTFTRAFQHKYPQHKKIARITWPMWFYVSVTGVLVYIMISPYYS